MVSDDHREALQAELFTLQEQLHDMDDNSGQQWVRGRAWVESKKQRMREILTALGEDTASVEAALNVIASSTHHPRLWTASLEVLQEEGIHYNDAEDDPEEFFIAPLTVPGPDGRSLTGHWTHPVLVDPPPKGADTDLNENGFTDNPKMVGQDARYQNLLYDLYLNQQRLIAGGVLDEPIDDLHTFAEWMACRMLLYGFNRIRNFDLLLKERYPNLKPVNTQRVKELARLARETTVEKRGKTYTDFLTALDISDAQELVATIYQRVPHAAAIVGAMTTGYCDAVRAERPSAIKPDAWELPEIVPGPVEARRDFSRMRRRCENLKLLVGDASKVGRAFGVNHSAVTALLSKPGRGRPRRLTYSSAAD